MKKITDELVESKMQARGFKDANLEKEDLLFFIRKQHGIDFDEFYNKSSYDFYIYEESTADGYSVFVAQYDDRRVNICEDVYYYDDDLDEVLVSAIYDLSDPDDELNFYITDMDSYWFLHAMQEVYNNDYDEELKKLMNELEDEGYEK